MKPTGADGSVRTAVITGGNSGIGEAIARELAAVGWQLVIAGRRQEENLRVVRDLYQEFKAKAKAFQVDVSLENECLGLVEFAWAEFGRIDLFINNAGIGGGGRIAETSTEVFEKVLRTNLYSAYWCSRESYKRMLEQSPLPETGLRGVIINLSSVCGIDAWAGMGTYCISKHGMMALTRAMADEGSRDGIRVAAICPALVSTPMTGVSGPEYIAPADIAATVTYLLRLSPAAWPVEMVVRRRGAE